MREYDVLYERYLDQMYATQRSQWRERLWAQTELNESSASGFLTGQGRTDKQYGKAMNTTESKTEKKKKKTGTKARRVASTSETMETTMQGQKRRHDSEGGGKLRGVTKLLIPPLPSRPRRWDLFTVVITVALLELGA